MPDPKQSFAVDDRREWLRIDDTLLLEYRVVGEPYVPTSVPDAAAAEETITTFLWIVVIIQPVNIKYF